MRFRADLHIHTDHDEYRNRWHGDHPERIAAGIVNGNLDTYAITEHNKMTQHSFDVREEIARLTEGTAKEILGLFGVEMTVKFGDYRYHLGYIFEEQFTPQNLPEMFPMKSDIKELEHYQVDYPGIVILNHPTWKDHRGRNDVNVTQELIESGLIDGVEIMNGSILHNGANTQITKSAIEMFLNARRKGKRLAAIGASDAHVGVNHPKKRPNLVGSVVTEYCTSTPEDIFHAIKQGETSAIAINDVVKKKTSGILRGISDGSAHRYIK